MPKKQPPTYNLTSLVLRWTLERLERLAFYRGAVKVHLSATRPTLVEASSGFSVRSYHSSPDDTPPPPNPPKIRLYPVLRDSSSARGLGHQILGSTRSPSTKGLG